MTIKAFRRGLRRRLTALTALAAAAAPAVAAPPIAAAADTVLTDGVVFGADSQARPGRAVAIRGGRILYVGPAAAARRYIGPRTRVTDLHGRLLLPGFIDTHNHVYLRAEELFWVKLPGGPRPIGPADAGVASLDTYRQAIGSYRAAHPGLRQVRGIGIDVAMIERTAAERHIQPRELLDTLVGDVPAVMIAHSHHEMLANTAAIRLAGLTKDTPTPAGGVVGRDPAGEPNGIFHEMSAQNLVLRTLPEPDFTVEEHRQAILSWQGLAAERGVTGTIVPTHYTAPNFFAAMQSLSDAGKLTAHYNVAQWVDESKGESQVPALVATRARFPGGPLFKLNTAKIFATGVPNSGLTMIWPQQSLERTMAALDKAGFRIYVHDIGPTDTYDKVLDAFAYAVAQNGRRDSRHIISHLFPNSAPTAGRFNAIGVRGDGHPAPKRFYDLGVPTTSSSDYPVWDFNPLPRIQTSVQQGVPLATALVSQTLRGAEALFAERETGSIAPGKQADLIVLDRNLFALPKDQIGQAKVVLTLFAGRVLYAAPGMDGHTPGRP